VRIVLIALVALIVAAPAAAHRSVPPGTAKLPLRERAVVLERAVEHHRYVARHGHGAARRWHRAALRWTMRELREVEAEIVPVGEAEIRAYLVRRVGEPSASCLATIIEWETAGTWDPTIDFGGGHGNVDEAYGLPQAYPGTKMESAGADWRTNPITQIEWMIRYANERYGSPCAAYTHRRDLGTY
jgi:hypothetical protein